jgi:pimeloyl-ACP methyl ester carboxylesterase
MQKETIVLLSSFGTNRILLEGLASYLDDYFDVDLVDFPGYSSAMPPFPNIAISEYIRYVEEYLRKAARPSYILGGLSFGYYVASLVKHDPCCSALVAISPFVGSNSLRMGAFPRTAAGGAISGIVRSGLYRWMWKRPDLIAIAFGLSPEQAAITTKEVDPKTYFKTARLILKYSPGIQFPSKPHVLAIDRNDDRINAGYIETRFRKEVRDLLVFPISMDRHYPRDMSKAYFQEHIPPATLEQMRQWLGHITK